MENLSTSFIGDEKRAEFFQRLRSHTREVAAGHLITFGLSKDDLKGEPARALQLLRRGFRSREILPDQRAAGFAGRDAGDHGFYASR